MRSLAVAVLGARALSVARGLGASAAAVALALAVGCAVLYTLHLVANGTTVGQPAPLPTAIFPCAGEMAAAAMVP